EEVREWGGGYVQYSPPGCLCRLQEQEKQGQHLQQGQTHGSSLPPPHGSHCLTCRAFASSASTPARLLDSHRRPGSSQPHCASHRGTAGDTTSTATSSFSLK
ncbi:hypothetical protein OTU49_008830, partial [Cherax quadricarinatus]